MGRSVMTHPRARVVAYTEWAETYQDYVDNYEPHYEGDEPMSEDEFYADYDRQQMHWEWEREWFIEAVKSQWPSFFDADRWPHNEVNVVLENGLAEIAISEYCGLTALSIAPLEDLEGREGLANAFIDNIEQKFLQQFSDYYKIGTFSNGESVYGRSA